MAEFVYKIFRSAEWQQAAKAGLFLGSPDDLRDGFLHFSAASQVRATCDRHFNSEHNLTLASVDVTLLGSALKWEVSRGGAKFPHLYAPLTLSAVHSVAEIRRDASGRFIFPPEIPLGE